MPIHLQRDIDKLKKDLLSICAIVEEQVQTAIRALLSRDQELAQEVERRDSEVDRREIELEEDCLKTLALHQPVACDLRLIIATLKINNDLERIGDLAVNIAHKAATSANAPPIDIPAKIPLMWQRTQSMLQDSLSALIRMDAQLAQSVCARDDEVDRLKHEIRVEIEAKIGQNLDRLHSLLGILAVSRNLERIADCATNIAEDVIYMIEGKIVRHRED